MPRLDEYPFDPEVAAALDAIDATLAGDPVDPEHAELAELALLLVAERPEIDDGVRAVAGPARGAAVRARRRPPRARRRRVAGGAGCGSRRPEPSARCSLRCCSSPA